MYFGLHFSYSNIDIEVSNSEILPRRIPISKLESFDLSSDKKVSKVLIKLIKEDVAALNEMNMGSKQWKLDGGSFELYDNLGVYLYRHPCLASCLQVMYSDIEQINSRSHQRLITSFWMERLTIIPAVIIITIACNPFFWITFV